MGFPPGVGYILVRDWGRGGREFGSYKFLFLAILLTGSSAMLRTPKKFRAVSNTNKTSRLDLNVGALACSKSCLQREGRRETGGE
jgi:hypothetical protein